MCENVNVVVCVLFFCLLRGSTSIPFVERSLDPVGNGVDEGEQRRSSDAGLVDSCVFLQESPTCGVDYSVPGGLALIAAAIEKDISEFTNGSSRYRTRGCMDAAKEVACAQRFPRCEVDEDGDVVVHLTSEGCEERLRQSCTDAIVTALLDDGHCALQTSTREAAGCRSTAEHAAEAETGSRVLQYCTQDLQVTPWMYELLLYYDAVFGAIAEGLEAQYDATCFHRQANFTCQMLGQCTEDGQRVELINTYETCESFITCFPDSHANRLRKQYNCSHWPHQVTTPPPTHTPSPTTGTTKTSIPTWPPPTATSMDMVGDSGHSLFRLSVTVLSLSLLLSLL